MCFNFKQIFRMLYNAATFKLIFILKINTLMMTDILKPVLMMMRDSALVATIQSRLTKIQLGGKNPVA